MGWWGNGEVGEWGSGGMGIFLNLGLTRGIVKFCKKYMQMTANNC
jgi:hypothetical protein